MESPLNLAQIRVGHLGEGGQLPEAELCQLPLAAEVSPEGVPRPFGFIPCRIRVHRWTLSSSELAPKAGRQQRAAQWPTPHAGNFGFLDADLARDVFA